MVTINVIEGRDGGEEIVYQLGKLAGHIRCPIPGCTSLTLEVITDEPVGVIELEPGVQYKPLGGLQGNIESAVVRAIERGGRLCEALERVFGISRKPGAS